MLIRDITYSTALLSSLHDHQAFLSLVQQTMTEYVLKTKLGDNTEIVDAKTLEIHMDKLVQGALKTSNPDAPMDAKTSVRWKIDMDRKTYLVDLFVTSKVEEQAATYGYCGPVRIQ